MNTIHDYVEKMFKHVVKTEETEQLKIDILANMEDRYQALIEEGASENEAVGTVIVEFGNIEEVLDEMGLSQEENHQREYDDIMVVELEDAHEYLEARRKAGLGIGLGVVACSIGVAGLVSSVAIDMYSISYIMIGVIWLLIMGVLGVSQFILQGLQLSRYKAYHSPFILVPEAQEKITELKELYKKSHIYSIISGIAFCVFSLIPVLLGVMTYHDDVILLGAAMMFIVASIGVLLFIYTGMKWTGYNNLLSQGKSFEEVTAARERYYKTKKVDHLLSNIYWPIVVISYFLMNYIFGGWAWTWIIFPIAGLFETIIKDMFNLEEK
ncbi:permease prefix domain 1-containing protein [Marinilactibacillus piezotolerans]|uniref:permease prefix domain 1-containing protein n=1 Tax=Marinilactibacillus piezotolerans TaxID=258723 RepID=UPI0009B0AE46|nr:permease prefix domain 1-containing protein [Marinilactibacillus piezotolerans]